jgi:hypothetical protein
MDLPTYVTEELVRARVADLRAAADRRRLACAAADDTGPLRERIGQALIRAGKWLAAPPPGTQRTPGHALPRDAEISPPSASR